MKTVEKIIPLDNQFPVDYAPNKNRDRKIPPIVLADEIVLSFSPSKYHKLQIAIVKEFASRFASGNKLLYVRDTADSSLYTDSESLISLGIPITEHSEFPDVILYDKSRQWLFIIDTVIAHGPVSPKRIIELEDLLKGCKVGKIYISAFSGFKDFKKHMANIAWDTEVWLMDFPEHMIHFNGNRFIGPR